MHEKYRNNKVWGGAIGSVAYKPSPKHFALKEQLRLPPLNSKPIFGNEKFGKLTLSDANIPQLLTVRVGGYKIDFGRLSDKTKKEHKPNTASITSQSVKNFDDMAERYESRSSVNFTKN